MQVVFVVGASSLRQPMAAVFQAGYAQLRGCVMMQLLVFLMTRPWVRQQGGCPLGLLLPRADDRTLIRHPSR